MQYGKGRLAGSSWLMEVFLEDWSKSSESLGINKLAQTILNAFFLFMEHLILEWPKIIHIKRERTERKKYFHYTKTLILFTIMFYDLNYLHCWKWHHFSSLVWQGLKEWILRFIFLWLKTLQNLLSCESLKPCTVPTHWNCY